MFTAFDQSTSFDPQLQSKFFAAPIEIRYAIYTNLIPNRVHLSLREASFRLSPCVQRSNDGDPDCLSRESYDANPVTGPRTKDSLYPRRLRSPWGEHWRCEENMQDSREKHGDIIATVLLLVCKQMFIDFTEMIADTVAIHVNDLDSLDTMISSSSLDTHASGCPHSVTLSLLRIMLPNLKDLRISLRIALRSYKALENDSDDIVFKSTWTELPIAVRKMSKLRRLRIWLDHSGPSTWTMVNERAVLSPLGSLGSDLLNVSINLPKLHPKWETPERHFTEDSAPLGVPIHRRYRQRYHAVEASNGELEVKYESDFPILYIFTELWDMTMEEMEEMERDEWKWGNPPEVVRSFEPANGNQSI